MNATLVPPSASAPDTLIAGACWPAARMGEALATLARRLAPRGAGEGAAAPAEALADRGVLARWFANEAERLGLDAHEVPATFRDFAVALAEALPAIVWVEAPAGPDALLLLRARGGKCVALAPDGREVAVSCEALRSLLCAEWEAPLRPAIGGMLERLPIAAAERERVREALLAEQLHAIGIEGIWSLRLAAGQPTLALARTRGLRGATAALVATHALQYAVMVLAWATLGGSVLAASLTSRALATWGALMLSLVPLRLLATWAEGMVTLRAGALLRERLLLGTLRLQPEEMRHEGAGAHLGRVIESEVVELAGVTGGVTALLSLVDLAGAVWVISRGAGAPLVLLLLAGWLALLGALGRSLRAARARWTDARIALTRDLVERLGGHETRLAQLPAERWHEGEEAALQSYAALSRHYDRLDAVWSALGGRGWMLLAVAAFAWIAAAGAGVSALAVTLGGMLLAQQAVARLAAGSGQLIAAGLSWRSIADLYRAAARPELCGDPGREVAVADPVLEADAMAYAHAGASEPVLRACTFRLCERDRVLLEGASGSGKSTLVSLVSGLREPGRGELRARGLTLRALGRDRWRQRIATAPQFHENHVFAGSLAFNILMGRQWPPRPGDVEDAERLCRELGLGTLLDRMPGGIHQVVGETGWTLSHGERNRVFLARGLLQRGELLVLDESFGALDPDTLVQVMLHVLKQDRALIVAGHF